MMNWNPRSSAQAPGDEQPAPYTPPGPVAHPLLFGQTPHHFSQTFSTNSFTPSSYHRQMPLPMSQMNMPPPMPQMNMHQPMNAPVQGGPQHPYYQPAVNSYYPPNSIPEYPSSSPFGPVNPYAVTVAEPAVPFTASTDPPFNDVAQTLRPRSHGVLKITNIPYNISIPEAHQFISKHVPSTDLIKPHQDGYPIHIIMERSTGKTMDCFVEMVSEDIAQDDWEHAFGPQCMRLPKIGQRIVTVEVSDQGELMEALFPRAVSVCFEKEEFGVPKQQPNRDPYSSGFKSFVTGEELTCMVRHAEYPQRSQFAARSLQRTFESMVSTLYKFPWYSVYMYSIEQRDGIYKSYLRQLEVLIARVGTSQMHPREVGLDLKLLMDFLFAGMNCPGFSERQRCQIAQASHLAGPGMTISEHAHRWPFQTLSADPASLSDKEIGQWLQILDHGMRVIEDENREFIGIHPNLHVGRDRKGNIVFEATESGCHLKRAEFATLEKEFMYELLHKGWPIYLRQYNQEPSASFDEELVSKLREVRAAEARGRPTPVPLHAFNIAPVAGPHVNYNEATGLYSNVRSDQVNVGEEEHDAQQQRSPFEDHVMAANMRDAAANKSLASFLELLRQTREEANEYDQGVTAAIAKTQRYDPNVDGLGAGLRNLSLGPGNHHGMHNRMSPMLNPESPVFQPQGWGSRRPNEHYHNNMTNVTAASSASFFSGPGLGNGLISPPRISTARKDRNRGIANAPVGLGIQYAQVPQFSAPPPSFEVPRRENRSLPIHAPDGTPVTFGHPSSSTEYADGNPVNAEPNAAPGNLMRTRAQSTTLPAMAEPLNATPVTPRRNSMGPNNNNNAVVMPAVGRPSPGHTHNYGLSSFLTFGGVDGAGSTTTSNGGRGGASSTHSSPSRSTMTNVGTIGGVGSMSGGMLATGGFISSPYPTSDGGARRARARSAFSLNETINEESHEEDDTNNHNHYGSSMRQTNTGAGAGHGAGAGAGRGHVSRASYGGGRVPRKILF